jgi:hypothetical protein
MGSILRFGEIIEYIKRLLVYDDKVLSSRIKYVSLLDLKSCIESVSSNVVIVSSRFFENEDYGKRETLDILSIKDFHGTKIVDAMNKGKKFDFEGSVIKGVAEYNLSYSPEVEVCYTVHKESTKYRKLNAIRSLFK